MAEYDNTNSFALFKNDKKDNPKRPDYTGKMNVDGINFRISGWVRESTNGKFISGSIQLQENTHSEYKKPSLEGTDEDVPF